MPEEVFAGVKGRVLTPAFVGSGDSGSADVLADDISVGIATER